MLQSIQSNCPLVKIGNISLDGSFINLPTDVEARTCIIPIPLLDLNLAQQVNQAIKVLLESKVQQENIYISSLLTSPSTIQAIEEAYSNVKIVTGAISDSKNNSVEIFCQKYLCR